MINKIKTDDIDVVISKIDVFSGDINNMYAGITIEWKSNIGFGQYTLYKEHGSNIWHADSEYMDSNDNKSFLEALLKQFISSVVIDWRWNYMKITNYQFVRTKGSSPKRRSHVPKLKETYDESFSS